MVVFGVMMKVKSLLTMKNEDHEVFEALACDNLLPNVETNLSI